MRWVVLVLARIGESDCEEIGSGLLKQPVNAVTSLVFSGFGIAFLAAADRVEGAERTNRIVFGWLMIATGIGSFLFHGPQWPASHFAHDVSFLVSVWFLAVINLSEAGAFPSIAGRSLFIGGTALISILLVVFGGATNVITVAVLVALAAGDVMVHRRGGIRRGWYVGAILALVIAVVMNIIGRSDSGLCQPGSLLQAHGAWHVLAAIALSAYFMATSRARVSGRRTEEQTR